MSTLFASLQNAAETLNVYNKAIGVVQSNVSNASTPGYAAQRVHLVTTVLGGVASGPIGDTRSLSAERSVWDQSGQLGAATTQASNLASIQSQFDVTGQAGIPGALSKLYSAFSSFSSTPSDNTVRTSVITAAQQVVASFHSISAQLQSSVQQVNQQIGSTATQINQLVSKVVAINVQIRNGADASGLRTQLYNTLQQVSNLTTISVHMELNGTATVLMNGQVPLVVGDSQTQLHVDYPSSTAAPIPGGIPSARIVTSRGDDVTKYSSGGELGGLLQVRNTTLPSLIGDENQQGSINTLAQGIADRVNGILTSGQVSQGPPSVAGSPLFTYGGASSGVASSLSLDPNASAANLAAIQLGPPVVSNGTAAQLARLQNPTSSSDMINGMSYTDYYSGIATDIGSQASTASDDKDTQTSLFNQADNLRTQLSGVSLDEQAAQLLQYQQGYQASSKMVSVINEMTQYLMDMIQ